MYILTFSISPVSFCREKEMSSLFLNISVFVLLLNNIKIHFYHYTKIYVCLNFNCMSLNFLSLLYFIITGYPKIVFMSLTLQENLASKQI